MPHHVVSYPAGQVLPPRGVEGQALIIDGTTYVTRAGSWVRSSGGGGAGGGSSYKGDLELAQGYEPGDLVSYEGDLLVTDIGAQEHMGLSLDRWRSLATRMAPAGIWSGARRYVAGDLVQRGGSLWRARMSVSGSDTGQDFTPGAGASYQAVCAYQDSAEPFPNFGIATTMFNRFGFAFACTSRLTDVTSLELATVDGAASVQLELYSADGFQWGNWGANDALLVGTATYRPEARPGDDPALAYFDFEQAVTLQEGAQYVLVTEGAEDVGTLDVTDEVVNYAGTRFTGAYREVAGNGSDPTPTAFFEGAAPRHVALLVERPCWELVFDASADHVLTGQVLRPDQTVADVAADLPAGSVVFQA